MAPTDGLDFMVRRRDWQRTRFAKGSGEIEPGPGQALFRVDRFALTANNISYAATGDLLGYWRFFPAPEGWGRLPAMGYGEIIASKHADVATGTRCFGFYPMSKYLLIEPASASDTSISDGAAHREGLAPVYSQYLPTGSDELYADDWEDETMLLRGLFMTSFLAEDFLADHNLFDAESAIISSASSKTSIALAFQISRRAKIRAIGLTSKKHLDFVRALGYYDEVLGYDDITSLPATSPAIFVDMAGNSGVSHAVHRHLGANLRYSQRIGATHWDAESDHEEPPGPTREFFFAPSQVEKRTRDWGRDGFQERLGGAWRTFRESSRDWLEVERGHGREAVERAYASTLAGRVPPNKGHVLSLWENA
jgi:hypothetical protein